ncbi:MAG: formylglycine-generating enzyme family protein [Moorea sp. SIO1G6]|nr:MULTISPECIES: formylglycine-generating enzyme family protein [unclassified Moorena]NEQ08846.1 formylglycine-generating enzyme family protein [Moorena sp. SIO4E2]NES81347.1 formylglycine-generating enzyme family protein [Moorena sp. SIO2B7]NET68926.1 formylglycine-generating enzyme family protein [Moorena sp. SIO1G6]
MPQTSQEEQQSNLIINHHWREIQYFPEDLGNGITLEMVAIPSGTFVMGSPETEEGHRDSESPQHQVTVKSFFMGKYPVTQAQWQAIAALPQVNTELKPDPSRFKGEDLPVERVSWYDAVEFCERLSQYTKRPYRLPSEAQWEYACRAGTTTPFHFGETITTEFANYLGIDDEELAWKGSYGNGPSGIYRGKTTPVGSFGVGNDFGLYDMHGNVWEWCADHWHDNYEGAPTDGSAWRENYNLDNYNLVDHNYPSLYLKDYLKEISGLLRGGSWLYYPVVCRSGSRFVYNPALWHDLDASVGFRVVCGCAWTP